MNDENKTRIDYKSNVWEQKEKAKQEFCRHDLKAGDPKLFDAIYETK